MNSNRRVLLFVTYSIGLFLLLSILALLTGWEWAPFRRVNLVGDLVTSPSGPAAPGDSTKQPPDSIDHSPAARHFAIYTHPRFITDFKADTQACSLPALARKLDELLKTGKGKIRIAYFGDSMIEGDLMTQTLRKLLQQKFGGQGVGFVPVTSQVSKFRQTVTAAYSDTWQDDNFKSGNNKRLYLSGHSFHSANAWVQLTDQTITDTAAVLEKSLLCGTYSPGTTINVNGQARRIEPQKASNRIVLANDSKRTIALGVANDQLPVYGVSFESDAGIFVDNFSFRGISGIELARIDSVFLSSIAAANPYDLIVFQYGVNLLFRPNDKNFDWYGRAMTPIIRKFQHCFPESEIVMVSTADRAFRYNGQYSSAVGIDSLIKVQATVAYETQTCFYNQFASMGGTNSIVEWATARPALANQDYVHPNFRGADILATRFYQALLSQYEKYQRSVK